MGRMTDDGPHPVRRDDYRPPPWLVERAELAFELDPAQTLVRAQLHLRRNPAAPAAPLRLDGEGLELRHIALDGDPLPDGVWRVDDRGLTVEQAPERCRLATRVAIHPAGNSALMGLYQAGPLLCTQCEPEAFRRITYFPDRPDVLARFRVTLRADPGRYPVLLANGNPAGSRRLADGRLEAVWDDPHPKPSYLFALVAGDLACVERRFVTASGRGVAVRMYVEAADSGRCGHALDAILRAMAWDEARYGREYDLEVFNAVAVSQYTMGAMENKGLNLFNDRYVLADADTATDRDHRDVEALVAHEYLHNWSGNRVTCRDWFQLALKEGFTVLREQQFVADQGWAGVRRIEDTRLMRDRQFAEDAGPLAHPVRPDQYVEIENFYTDTVYSKGAEVLRMLHTLLGEAIFRRGCDLYFERHDGQAVTVEALLDCLAEASSRDLTGFLEWYRQPGTPRLSVEGRYDPEAGTYELRVHQGAAPVAGEAPRPLPLAVGLLGPDGAELPLALAGEPPDAAVTGTRVLAITRRSHSFLFTGLDRRPVPALLRGFSAPVELQAEYSDDERALLAIHDPDPVVRWDAVQALALASLAGHDNGPYPAEEHLEAVFRQILESRGGDPAVEAELLALPSEGAIALRLPALDVDTVHRARQGLRAHLARRLGGALGACYRACQDDAPYAATPAQIGRRAVKNTCLGYLAHPCAAGGIELCLAQYRQASNLTDAVAALGLLADSDHPSRVEALADFRRRHGDRPLVLDKWLAVQARSARPDALEQVQALTRDRLFSLHEPNRVRSLVEVFAGDNPAAFHRADGAGYRFLADMVVALDPVNPSLAAVLLRHLSDWRRLDGGRAARMHAELERIARQPRLSRGAWELLRASLDGSPGV